MTSIEGNIVDNIEEPRRGRIEIADNGLIAFVGKETGKADVVLKEELIFPGFIDLHVHARECSDHSQDYKEDFASAGQAAINGGVVAFADMPNNPLPPVDDKSYSDKLALAKKSAADVLLYGGIGPNTSPLLIKVPYKLYMGKSVGDLFFADRNSLEKVLEKYQRQNISFHCEDGEILKQHELEPMHELKRPPEAETTAVDFALRMIEKYQLAGKICHVSTKEAMEKIMAARKRGVKVTVEVTPHHLFFDQTMLTDDNRQLFQVNPPIRQTPENRLALIKALKKGDIDYLATDHAPHIVEEKAKGASGLPHLDTYGPFASWLIKQHKFTPKDVARVCSFNPGNFISDFLPQPYGKIAEGFVGSLTVIDMNKPLTVQKANLKTKCGWSPFEGMTFPGSVKFTVIKGKIYGN